MIIARPLGRLAAVLVALAAPLGIAGAIEAAPPAFAALPPHSGIDALQVDGGFPLGTAEGHSAPALQLAQAQLDPSRQLAAVVARLGQLEEEVRRLRGRVEELEFNQDRLQARPEAPTTSAAPITRPGLVERTPPAPTGSAPTQAGQPGSLPGAPPAPTQVARVDPTAPAREQYEAALTLLQQGDWTAAQGAFDGFLQRFPNDALAPNAAYWLGETHYIRKDYANAAAIFARNYRGYGPDSPKAPDNLLKLGMSLASLGDRERACQTFTELERRHGDAAAPVRQALVRERAAAGCS